MKFNFKFIIAIFIVLYAIITLLFFNFYKEIAIKDTRQEAGSMLNSMNAIRTYIEEIQRPMIYNLIEDNQSLDKYFDARILSSTYISQYIYEKQRQNKELKYRYKLVATNPLNPIHMATDFEANILNKFRDNKIQDYFSIIKENGESYFFIAKPISRNTKACLLCHGNPADAPKRLVDQYGDTRGFYEKEGDLRAMIYLKIAISDIIEYHKDEFVTGGITMFAVFIIFIILIYIIYNKNVKLQERKEILFEHQNRLAVMGSMIGNISHQWKQPLSHLSSMLINIELLSERGKLSHEKVLSKIGDANEQISFMSNTINDFKNFFSPKEINSDFKIEDIIGQSVRLLQASLNKNNIKVIIDIEENFTFVGSRNEFVQVFVNIINNAKDAFISNKIENREILIRSYKNGGKTIVSIQNNAGEISKEVIDKIFKPYFSTKDLSVATGIGLYICKVIIERYKGDISVKNIDDGVIFKIKF
ncbi:c-type heme family protein [Halarcobacter ebronensis]|uniref:histidine kinase n=1 Tax=Halarcobacter ebronensis TaxID=1462615 RepID=A0A4Q1ANF3_9BACT|nr:DUF3365 domain-containing protein [Halarcobacter ebronensis]QKF82592.1 two-component system sensor histidine kinase (DUF3365 domain) [Halarcobacter ebronensis]RXK07397.1 histidine kinase [Halarcobacter ebronensis]